MIDSSLNFHDISARLLSSRCSHRPWKFSYFPHFAPLYSTRGTRRKRRERESAHLVAVPSTIPAENGRLALREAGVGNAKGRSWTWTSSAASERNQPTELACAWSWPRLRLRISRCRRSAAAVAATTQRMGFTHSSSESLRWVRPNFRRGRLTFTRRIWTVLVDDWVFYIGSVIRWRFFYWWKWYPVSDHSWLAVDWKWVGILWMSKKLCWS